MRDKLSRTNEAVVQIRQVHKQVEELTARLEAGPQSDKTKEILGSGKEPFRRNDGDRRGALSDEKPGE